MNIDRTDIYFWTLIAMSGFVMYYVFIVVDPTYQILSKQDALLNLTVQQNHEIINNTNRNGMILAAYINKSIANQDENLYFLATILNQSNIIGNETADLILESINKTTELTQNVSRLNNIQRADIVMDITAALEHIDKQLNGLSQQHTNLTSRQTMIKNDTGTIKNQTGKISGFLGGPIITNDTLDAVKAGIIAQAQNRNGSP